MIIVEINKLKTVLVLVHPVVLGVDGLDVNVLQVDSTEPILVEIQILVRAQQRVVVAVGLVGVPVVQRVMGHSTEVAEVLGRTEHVM